MGCSRSGLVVLLLSVVAGTAGATRPAPPPPPGAEITIAALGWPASTTAATVRRRADVLAAPIRGPRLATVVPGTRVTWRRLVASGDGCRAWLELEPRGWACARDLAPTDAPPPPPAPPRGTGWADVRKDGADAYPDLAAIRARQPSRFVGDKTNVALRGAYQTVDGVAYAKTDQGWIEARALVGFAPSSFAGLELAPTAVFDFGWAVARLPGRKIAVREAAAATAKQVRELSPRDRVTVLEVAAGFARIGDGEWVDAVELRRAERKPRPLGIGAYDNWIDVDLDQQIAVLYEGDTPVFVTLVSTGKVLWDTPTGIYRIRSKEPIARMQDPGGMSEEWNVADVPYAMAFRKNFALHGTYWHDGFGRRRSHGCVNLSTADARRVYEWVSPRVPAGWVSVVAGDEGTPVRIRSRLDPEPRWYDYSGAPLPRLGPNGPGRARHPGA